MQRGGGDGSCCCRGRRTEEHVFLVYLVAELISSICCVLLPPSLTHARATGRDRGMRTFTVGAADRGPPVGVHVCELQSTPGVNTHYLW